MKNLYLVNRDVQELLFSALLLPSSGMKGIDKLMLHMQCEEFRCTRMLKLKMF